MFLVFIIFFVFVAGGYSLGKFASSFISDNNTKDESEIKIINHNYTTHNHLHITERQLKELANNSKS